MESSEDMHIPNEEHSGSDEPGPSKKTTTVKSRTRSMKRKLDEDDDNKSLAVLRARLHRSHEEMATDVFNGVQLGMLEEQCVQMCHLLL